VEDIATITFRYELLTSKESTYDRRTTDRLIQDMKDAARRSAAFRQRDET
jgi:hypothetical protein